MRSTEIHTMTFDLDMIRAHYERIPGRIEAARGATGKAMTIEVEHADGSKDTIVANHTYNVQQIDWFRAGSALNLIKQQH